MNPDQAAVRLYASAGVLRTQLTQERESRTGAYASEGLKGSARNVTLLLRRECGSVAHLNGLRRSTPQVLEQLHAQQHLVRMRAYLQLNQHDMMYSSSLLQGVF